VLGAAEEPPVHGPLGPEPRSEPLIPGAQDSADDPAAALARKLRDRLRDIDSRMSQILREHEGRLPTFDVARRSELDEEQAARDAAWQRLRQTVKREEQSDVAHREPDMLMTPAARGEDAQVDDERSEAFRELVSQNRMSIAYCHKALAEPGEDTLAHLENGLEAVRTIEVEHLAEHDRPQLYLLRVWFASELAPRVDEPERRQALLNRARTVLEVFAREHPDSVLLENARYLIDHSRLAETISDKQAEVEGQ